MKTEYRITEPGTKATFTRSDNIAAVFYTACNLVAVAMFAVFVIGAQL